MDSCFQLFNRQTTIYWRSPVTARIINKNLHSGLGHYPPMRVNRYWWFYGQICKICRMWIVPFMGLIAIRNSCAGQLLSTFQLLPGRYYSTFVSLFCLWLQEAGAVWAFAAAVEKKKTGNVQRGLYFLTKQRSGQCCHMRFCCWSGYHHPKPSSSPTVISRLLG